MQSPSGASDISASYVVVGRHEARAAAEDDSGQESPPTVPVLQPAPSPPGAAADADAAEAPARGAGAGDEPDEPARDQDEGRPRRRRSADGNRDDNDNERLDDGSDDAAERLGSGDDGDDSDDKDDLSDGDFLPRKRDGAGDDSDGDDDEAVATTRLMMVLTAAGCLLLAGVLFVAPRMLPFHDAHEEKEVRHTCNGLSALFASVSGLVLLSAASLGSGAAGAGDVQPAAEA